MNRIFKTSLTLLAVIIVGLTQVSCDGSKQYRKVSGVVWATTYNITYEGGENLADSLQRVFRAVEESLSPFTDSSLISLINRGESSATDTLIRRVFATSQVVNRASGGMFDPTVSPLINLWGFGYTDKNAEVDTTLISTLLQSVGIADCRIDGDTLMKKSPATQFNFSAITKGYGCDLVGEMLKRNGVENYMVEIGGEMALRGKNQRGEPWHVMIDAPVESADTPVHSRMALVTLTDVGVATSGNYRNYAEKGGRKVWHTISPVSGYPVTTATVSATVVAPTAMLADALATACMAMDVEDAETMLKQFDGVKWLIVTAEDEDGEALKFHKSEDLKLE